MTALNTFIDTRLPADVTQCRDYVGGRGWVSLCNQVLRRLENEGLIRLTQFKEAGVEVVDGYWINFPSDYRNGLELRIPGFGDPDDWTNIPFSEVNGRIKLNEAFGRSDAPDTFTLSAGGLTSIAANDADAVADQWKDYLLVLTNGTYSGDQIIIGEHDAATAGVVTLNFLHPRLTSIVTSTTGYLTNMYLMIRYMAQFNPVTAASSDIPVDARFENVLINGLCYLSKPVTSDERKAYRQEFENDIELLKAEIFTPTPDQARPVNRSMAALEDCSGYTSTHNSFVGDENAWAE
jgi:hypothetical protein